MERFYVVCSSPECSFSKQDDFIAEGCPFCAADVLRACPDCGQRLRDKGQVFCTSCRNRLKPPAPAATPA